MFDDNLEIKNYFTKSLKVLLVMLQLTILLRIFLNYASAYKISPHYRAAFGRCEHQWVNPIDADVTFVQSTRIQRSLKNI